MLRYSPILIACLAFLSVSTARADLAVNGGFETGTFAGWSQINSGSGGITIDDGTFDPAGPGLPVAPFSGTFAAATFQGGPGQHTLYQDVTLGAGLISATLNWADHIENWAGVFSDPNQEWRVEVWNTSNVFQAELFSTNPGDATMQPWTMRSADLSPWIGQTVRLAFTQQDNLSFFNARLDAVSVNTVVPVPGAFALGLLGLGGVGWFRRRFA